PTPNDTNKRSTSQPATEDSGYESDAVSLDSEAEGRLEHLKADLPHLAKFYFSRSATKPCRIVLTYDSATPKLLLLPIIEKCAHQSLIHAIPGLGLCTQFMENILDANGKIVKTTNPDTGEEEDAKEPIITTQGVNLVAMRDNQHIINPNTIRTNSVHDMMKYYGIEAARVTIINEISAVFSGHGITVDNRHINLIADAMTQTGRYLPFSRHGVLKESSSVLAKMSFETVMGFLREGVLGGGEDDLSG
ncbi:MAG: hypothetical protein M1823_007133, partial [Watsoniomyces obsoletus]